MWNDQYTKRAAVKTSDVNRSPSLRQQDTEVNKVSHSPSDFLTNPSTDQQELLSLNHMFFDSGGTHIDNCVCSMNMNEYVFDGVTGQGQLVYSIRSDNSGRSIAQLTPPISHHHLQKEGSQHSSNYLIAG